MKWWTFWLIVFLYGCSSAPIIDFDGDPHVQEVKRLSLPPHPLSVSLAPLEVERKLALEIQRGRLIEAGEEVEKKAQTKEEGESEYRYSLPFEEEKFRQQFYDLVEKNHVFQKLATQPQKDGPLPQQLKNAWKDNCDILLHFKINRYEVYYSGINAWYVPNLLLWSLFIFPAWYVPDEIYGAKIEVEVKAYSVHSGFPVFEKIYKTDIKKDLDDFDRGYQIAGILRVPGSLSPSNWRAVEESLMPYALHEVKKKIYKDMVEEFSRLQKTPEFQGALNKTMALFVGVSRYKDFYIPKLNYSHEDPLKIYKVFLQAGYPAQNLTILQDEYATKENVEKALQELKQRARKGDTVLVYFSGRGYGASKWEDSHLLLFDSQVKNLSASALSLKNLREDLNALLSQKVILCLDTSFCGETTGKSLKSKESKGTLRSLKEFLTRSNLVVLTGSSVEEPCYELKEIQSGIFSHCFWEALSGKADTNPKDGKITLQEVYDYVREEIPRLAGIEGLSQYPVWNGAIAGDVILLSRNKVSVEETAIKKQGRIEGKVLGIELEEK